MLINMSVVETITENLPKVKEILGCPEARINLRVNFNQIEDNIFQVMLGKGFDGEIWLLTFASDGTFLSTLKEYFGADGFIHHGPIEYEKAKEIEVLFSGY